MITKEAKGKRAQHRRRILELLDDGQEYSVNEISEYLDLQRSGSGKVIENLRNDLIFERSERRLKSRMDGSRKLWRLTK